MCWFWYFRYCHAPKICRRICENGTNLSISALAILLKFKLNHPHYAGIFHRQHLFAVWPVINQVMKVRIIFYQTSPCANPKVALVAHASGIQQAACMTIRRRSLRASDAQNWSPVSIASTVIWQKVLAPEIMNLIWSADDHHYIMPIASHYDECWLLNAVMLIIMT